MSFTTTIVSRQKRHSCAVLNVLFSRFTNSPL